MFGFLSVAILLLVGLLLMLVPRLLRPTSRPGAVTGESVSLAVFRDQLREAERDLENDVISPERFAETKAEIERRLLEASPAGPASTATPRPATVTAALLLVLLPLASLGTYWWLGAPQVLGQAPAAPAVAAQGDGHSVDGDQIQRMVASLSEKLKTNPDNAEGWMMLGRSYTVLGRYNDAAVALKRANELAPGNPTLLADYADVLGVLQGRRLAGQPAQLVRQALDVDPRHVKALALAGTVAFQDNDYVAAIDFWQRLLKELEPSSDMARSIRGSVADAESRLARAGATPAPTGGTAAAAAPASVSGSVTISPALAARVQPGDTVYVFARAAQGPRMPLAILRLPAGAWPLDFTLDDSMAMSPQLRLSGFASVVIGARVSRSGNATPQPGDLTGESAPVAPGARSVQLTIDGVQR